MADQGDSAEEAFAELSRRLLATLTPLVGPWVEHQILTRLPSSHADRSDMTALARQAGRAAAAHVGPRLEQLLSADIGRQRTNPLALLREATPFATDVLRSVGVPPAVRDEHARAMHPDDHYDVSPGAFSDFGEAAHEAGLLWGAAKAHLHLRQRSAK
ncbi:MAG: hypothetical protein O3C27_03970 [Actinomycetota bacterium]|nr:hypothetical protein [Actinomycetota bacterium]